MRNYALSGTEAATARAALLVVETHLLGKKKELDEVLKNETYDPEMEPQLHRSNALIVEQLEKVKAALDALK